MKGLWIRVEAHEVDSLRVGQLADPLRVDPVTSLGHYVALGGAIAEHAPEGNLGDVPDALIERWARWTGEPGVFARSIREIFVDCCGEFAGWRESMGKLIERREKDRARKSGGDSAEIPRKIAGDSVATERNGTGRSSPSADEDFESSPAVLPRGLSQADVAPLLARVEQSGGQQSAWLECLIRATDDGASAAHLRAAIGDYLGHGGSASPSLMHFRGFIAKAMQPRVGARMSSRPVTPARPSKLMSA